MDKIPNKYKRAIKRPTKSQITTLIDYMVAHPTFARLQQFWTVKGPAGPRRQLEKLVENLNCLGPKRTGVEWIKTWRDLKRRARIDCQEAKQAAEVIGFTFKMSELSDQTQKILSIFYTEVGTDVGEDDPRLGENEFEPNTHMVEANILHIQEPSIRREVSNIEEPNTLIEEPNIHIDEPNIHFEDSITQEDPKSEDIYEIVITYCMDLVRVHGRPVELFDDLAFRNIIKLVPLSETQRNSLDSKTMKLVLGHQGNTQSKNENDGASLMTTVEIQRENTDEEMSNCNKKIKQETNASPTYIDEDNSERCTCPTKDTTSNTHAHNCNIQHRKPCGKYFHIFFDRAECNLCKMVMEISNISVLLQHLHSKHPEIQFQEKNIKEEPISEKCNLSSPAQSTQDMEEYSLHFDDKHTNQNHTPIENHSKNDSMELSDIKFKALESFGVYIVSLLKIIPEKRCAKLQGLIVQKLLQEQIAAC